MNEELKQLLGQLYPFLRDHGFGEQSEAIRRLMYYVEIGNLKKFRNEYKSSMIWGGAGSIRDIDLRDCKEQNKLIEFVKELKMLGAKV